MTPEELAFTVDAFHQKKQQRLEADKIAAELKKEEHELSESIMQEMLRSGLTAAGGRTLRLTLKGPTQEPQIKDWNLLCEFVKKTNSFDLLYRRVNAAAAKERREAGVQVDGVDWFPVYKLSESKRNAS